MVGSTDVEAAEPDERASEGGGKETAFAIGICLLGMVGPVWWIQTHYDSFVAEHGEARVGAAGAALALAVVLRTVSRTVLRTMVRSSARAGVRASIKGAMRSNLRMASRALLSGMLKNAFGEVDTAGRSPAQQKKANLKSLAAGSALLYISWVVVLGFGQPFAALKTAEQAAGEFAAEEQAKAAAKADPTRTPPEVKAWKFQEVVQQRRKELLTAKLRRKGSRTAEAQAQAERGILLAHFALTEANAEFAEALAKANGRVVSPDEQAEEAAPTALDAAVEWLFTRAPYPGSTAWASPVVWLGGLGLLLPFWLILGVQGAVAKRLGVPLRHETGMDGAIIQLYFAGAFSFMPLSSDTVVDGTAEEKGKVSSAGLLVPTALAIVLWSIWKVTGGTSAPLLFLADAFLIYPMVQSFPLDPLDGVQLWRWSKLRWALVFTLVMGCFLFMGSEGLKHVI